MASIISALVPVLMLMLLFCFRTLEVAVGLRQHMARAAEVVCANGEEMILAAAEAENNLR